MRFALTAPVLDGEIVCLGPDGGNRFYNLLFRREWPHVMAFDVLAIDGKDLRGLPLVERKRQLAPIMPRVESRVMLLERLKVEGDADARPATSADADASGRRGRAIMIQR